MLGTLLIIGVVVLTIVLGVVNYYIGKAGRSEKAGAVIPAGYFAVRVLMDLIQNPGLGKIFIDMVPAAAIALIYYALYRRGFNRR